MKKVQGIPTIDVELVVVRTNDVEIAVDTASKIGVETAIETTDAVKLVKLGRLLSQKPASNTVTGTTITLTDNVFVPELVQILQGGTVEYDENGDVVSYTPPVAGSSEKGVVFYLDAYSAVYDTSGQILKYEKVTYPNCQGNPVTLNSEDNVFRVSEYTISSAPRTGEAPYKVVFVKELPTFDDESEEDVEAQQERSAEGRTYSIGMPGTGMVPSESGTMTEY